VNRNNAATPDINFNPYALQVNDEITVTILISNMTWTLSSLVDEYLVTKGVAGTTHTCVGTGGSGTINPSTGASANFTNSSQVTFSNISQDATSHTATVSYHCTVN